MRGVLAIFRHSKDFLDSMIMEEKNNIIIKAKHTNVSGQFPTPMFFFPHVCSHMWYPFLTCDAEPSASSLALH